MRIFKGVTILVAAILCVSGIALAADRVVVGEMFTNTS